MDVIDLLIQQHREVDALFLAFRNASDGTSRRELCIQPAEALMLHSTMWRPRPSGSSGRTSGGRP